MYHIGQVSLYDAAAARWNGWGEFRKILELLQEEEADDFLIIFFKMNKARVRKARVRLLTHII